MRRTVPLRLLRFGLTLGVVGCGAVSTGDSQDDTDRAGEDVVDPTDDTDRPLDTDRDDPVDTDTDTDPTVDTDTDPPADTDLPDDTDDGPGVPFAGTTGGFVDILAAVWATGTWWVPPEDEEFPNSFKDVGIPTWGDVNNDGEMELVMHGVRRVSQPPYSSRLTVFHPNGQGGWREDAALANRIRANSPSYVCAIVDLDGDGDDDVLRSSLEDGLIQLNDGNDLEWADIRVSGSVFIGRRQVQPVLVDFDRDGWLDILNGAYGCSGNPNTPRVFPVIRTGLRTWTAMPELIPQSHDGNAFALIYTDLGQGHDTLMFLGDTCDSSSTRHPGFYRPGPLEADGYARWPSFDGTPANAYYRLQPGSVGTYVTRKQPMGGASFDADADGILDVILAPSDTLMYVFLGGPTWPMVDATLSHPAALELGPTGDPKLPWGVVAMDMDLDGYTDMVVGRGDDARFVNGQAAYNGPYEPAVFWNDRGRGFIESRQLVGLGTFPGESHYMAAEDFDGDGDRDLMVGGLGLLPRILRNDLQPQGRRLTLRLHGTTSNHLAAGAIVRAFIPGMPPIVHRVGSESTEFGIADFLVVLAGGTGPTVPQVDITWPTGVTQTYVDLATDTVHELTEPPLIVLSEDDRHLPANGTSRLTVEVSPRDAQGAPRVSQDVDIEAIVGDATWEGPAVQDGATWRRVLVAPTTPGSSVIEVTVDGVPVQVRPRVWWDFSIP